MYETCPKCAYRRKPTDTAPASQCPACGLNFAKWMQHQFRAVHATPVAGASQRASDAATGLAHAVFSPLFAVKQRVDGIEFYPRVLLYVVLVAWGAAYISTDHTKVVGGAPDMARVDFLMNNVNLVFHEAGHVLFRPFGLFMMVLGGSLMQVLMPLVVLVFFVWRHGNPFGGMVALWWAGQSTLGVAVYVYDALPGRLLLLGGMTGQDAPGYHDWARLLAWMGKLQKHAQIAAAVDLAGVLLMLLAFAWGGYLLWLQYRNLDR